MTVSSLPVSACLYALADVFAFKAVLTPEPLAG